MMFEVQDLAVASPATVSRCGMVYLEPSILGLNPFVKCWIQRLPDCIFDHKDKLNDLFERYLEVIFQQLSPLSLSSSLESCAHFLYPRIPTSNSQCNTAI